VCKYFLPVGLKGWRGVDRGWRGRRMWRVRSERLREEKSVVSTSVILISQ